MNILNAQPREASAKGNQLRRAGIIPGVLFGKHLEESISIQVPKNDVEHFLHHNSIGSKVDLMIGKKKYMALLKDVTYTPAINTVEHLSFQAMTKGEKVSSVAHIILHNKDKVDGIVQQSHSEIAYKALPADLVDRIEIDLTGKGVGDSLSVGELEFFQNKDIETLIPLESLVFSITAHIAAPAEEAPAPAVSAEVPVFEGSDEA
jgi:large subunit ribosomal protein L25